MTTIQPDINSILRDGRGLAMRVELLAPDVTTWLASPQQGLVATIDRIGGSHATAQALARLAPPEPFVVSVVEQGDLVWAELECDGTSGGEESSILGVSRTPDGLVSRIVWLRAQRVPRPELVHVAASPDARPVFESYFDDLNHCRFQEASSHFTVNTIYSHPPYAGGTERVLYLGRHALCRGFIEDRGESPVRHVIVGCWQEGSRVFLEGVIDGVPNGGTFFSTGRLTPTGHVDRYVAFYTSARLT
jgi:hypothetical protein